MQGRCLTATQDNGHTLLLAGWEPQEAAVSTHKLWREDTLEQKALRGQRSHGAETQPSELHVHPKYNWDANDADLIDTLACVLAYW